MIIIGLFTFLNMIVCLLCILGIVLGLGNLVGNKLDFSVFFYKVYFLEGEKEKISKGNRYIRG